ncbi:MAG: amidohydrolase family protein [Planctomycetota bacterium]|nr:amidohydrolase family protein [Planctomycetota bacterium]
MDTLIFNARVMQPGEGLVGTWLRIRDGKIFEFGTCPPDSACEGEDRIDAGRRLLTPGLIDLHTHGICEHAYEAGPGDLVKGLREAPRFGSTCILPTLCEMVIPGRLDRLAELAAALDKVDSVAVPGFHFEGPFVVHAGAGLKTLPGDVGLLYSLVKACDGRMAAMSLSPDTENVLPVIKRLHAMRIPIFMTHTSANVEQTQAAIEAGARHATHFYNVFFLPEEKEMGLRPVGAVETILADPRCTVDFICDGIHVHPMAVKSALAAKGAEGVALITDSNIGAGMPAGVYQTPLAGQVRVSPEDAARIDEPGHKNFGCLAGSSLTMDRGISNLMYWLDLPEAEVWAMATRTPARILGLPDKGVIRVGADADLVLWTEESKEVEGKKQKGTKGTKVEYRALRTWVGGRCVFARDRETAGTFS